VSDVIINLELLHNLPESYRIARELQKDIKEGNVGIVVFDRESSFSDYEPPAVVDEGGFLNPEFWSWSYKEEKLHADGLPKLGFLCSGAGGLLRVVGKNASKYSETKGSLSTFLEKAVLMTIYSHLDEIIGLTGDLIKEAFVKLSDSSRKELDKTVDEANRSIGEVEGDEKLS